MRRLEVERIDEAPAGNRRLGWGRRCGLWAANHARQPRRWLRARARGLVWRLRAVPRTHGTRADPGFGFLVIPSDGC